MTKFLIRALIAVSSLMPSWAEIPPELGLEDISGTFINKREYRIFIEKVPFEDRRFPEKIKIGKENFMVNLEGEILSNSLYYPFLRYIAESAIKRNREQELIGEMIQWIESESVKRRVSAWIVLGILFPEEENVVTINPVSMTLKDRKKIGEKYRALNRAP